MTDSTDDAEDRDALIEVYGVGSAGELDRAGGFDRPRPERVTSNQLKELAMRAADLQEKTIAEDQAFRAWEKARREFKDAANLLAAQIGALASIEL